jgi:glycosyltransferase involved in cell wall biosynthesis
MRIYWYWPHPHRNPSPLAKAILRGDDELTVQALSAYRGEAIRTRFDDYEVIRDLPDPACPGGRKLLHFIHRAANFYKRLRARERLVGSQRFDIAHIQTLQYEIDWLLLPRLRRQAKVIGVVHDVRPHVRRFPFHIETYLLKRLYSARSLDALIVYHDILKKQLETEFGIEAGRIHTVPHPLLASDIERPLIASDERTVLFFGSFRKNKGIPVLVEAIESIMPRAGTKFIFAGRGDSNLENLVRDAAARRQDVIAEIGQISPVRKRELFLTASLVVLPYTRFNSQSGVLADAYQHCVPLVVTDVGALGPTVKDDKTGLVVRPCDVEALAGAITCALDDRHQTEEFRKAIESARNKHSYEKVGLLMRRIYEVVLSA